MLQFFMFNKFLKLTRYLETTILLHRHSYLIYNVFDDALRETI